MTLASRFLARLLELPPADTHDVTVERDLEVPTPDGTRLLADRYAPRHGASYLGLVQWAERPHRQGRHGWPA